MVDHVPAAAPSVRVGVSVEVPEPWGSQVQEYRCSLGDDASGVPTHITLVPPTEVVDSAEEMERVAQALAGAAQECAPFPVRLRGTDTFRPVTPVVFLAVAEGADCLARLAGRARSGPLAVRDGFPFHPHVTLAQEVDDEQLDRALVEQGDVDASFTVSAVTLYRFRDGDGWRPERRFDLTGEAPVAGSPGPPGSGWSGTP